ncbi:hypothetical protein BD410DRAFT_805427 [Rickenella mellea]|uniref:Uncharacterized protein n=1 Tax=Rickenella mellea TaxID=50990 RepID=A0A4Y7PY61_9AGAM|nr:hypothetical protein BD410DRAFT_805427 [Rickenella mellea]
MDGIEGGDHGEDFSEETMALAMVSGEGSQDPSLNIHRPGVWYERAKNDTPSNIHISQGPRTSSPSTHPERTRAATSTTTSSMHGYTNIPVRHAWRAAAREHSHLTCERHGHLHLHLHHHLHARAHKRACSTFSATTTTTSSSSHRHANAPVQRAWSAAPPPPPPPPLPAPPPFIFTHRRANTPVPDTL